MSVAFDFNGMHFDEGLRVFAPSRESERRGHAKDGTEERRAFNHLFPLRAPLRTLRLYSMFGYSMPHVPGSSCIVKSPDSGLGT